MLLSRKIGDLVYVCSNLQLDLINVAKDETNSSTPWMETVPNAHQDQDDFDNESHESNGDRDSSGFTRPCALDDIELFDVTSRPQEQQE